MIIYPAIDLIDAKVVRLTKGDYGQKTEYSADPVEVARQFEASGAEFIHIVDLDGAKAKQPVNTKTIRSIKRAVNIPVQVGGGIRSIESAKDLLDYADRAIIGTIAVTEPEKLKEMLDKFGKDKIVVSVDYKDGLPAVNGWLEAAALNTNELQIQLKSQGIRTVIVTDTERDGLMKGPNTKLMKLWKQAGFEVICAGGVTTAKDIASLAKAGVDGAIIGKALYENKITLKGALDAG